MWIDADRLNICVFLLWSKKGRELHEILASGKKMWLRTGLWQVLAVVVAHAIVVVGV